MVPANDWFERLPRTRLLAEVSLWSADLGRIADEIARIDDHVDLYHLDVADGHFAPALLLFPDLVAACRKMTDKPFHVHLMIADTILPEQLRQFAEAGADLLSIHAEHRNVDRALDLIAALDLRAGIVLQVDTPVATAAPWLDRIAFLTLLGTRIGIKGQELDPGAGVRMTEAAAMIAAAGRSESIVLAADGGIRDHTVAGLHRSGAGSVVLGSLAFGAPDLAARMSWVRAFTSGMRT